MKLAWAWASLSHQRGVLKHKKTHFPAVLETGNSEAVYVYGWEMPKKPPVTLRGKKRLWHSHPTEPVELTGCGHDEEEHDSAKTKQQRSSPEG